MSSYKCFERNPLQSFRVAALSGKQQYMVSGSDQRLTPRFTMNVPFLFCMVNSPFECGHAATTVNISKRGIFFVTGHPLFVGLPVRLLLRMPSECGGPAARIVMTGLISRVTAQWGGEDQSGVGVEFIYSEPFHR